MTAVATSTSIANGIGRVFSLSLRPVPQAVTLARDLVRFAFTQWRLVRLIDDGCLIISELTSNAVEHTPEGSFVVDRVLWPDGGGPLIEVWDGSTDPLRFTGPAEPLAEHGRGLYVVRNLAARLSVFPLPGGSGKAVQAAMNT